MKSFRKLLVGLLGNFSWQPPGWARLALRHRGVTFTVLAACLLAGGGLRAAWVGYQNRPKPVTVSVQLETPGITPFDDRLRPRPLVLLFGKSAAPLEWIQRRNPPGIQMTPEIPGEWLWVNGSRLVFTPREDWPADVHYRVTLEPKALGPQVLLAKNRFDWATPPFTAKIREINFYQNPKDPEEKQVVATIDFSHSVDPESLNAKARFTMVGRRAAQEYQVTFDKFRRTAYLRTSSLALPEREDFMKLVLSAGIQTTQGGAETRAETEARTRLPDIYSFFQINGIDSSIVWNTDGDPEQILIVRTTALARSEDVARALGVTWIPPKPTSEGPVRWEAVGEVEPAVVQMGTPVPVSVVPSKDELTRDHTFRIRLAQSGQLFARISAGLKARGDFVLKDDFVALVNVPEPPRRIAFQGEGGVLALDGEKRLSVRSRNVPVIRYEVARVLASEINHLVSQTEGRFQDPEFRSYSFDEENISRIAREDQSIVEANPFTQNDTTFDFTPHLAISPGDGMERGLFFLRARGWDPIAKCDLVNVSEQRFILVTDLGLIVKQNADESREVFVGSIQQGQPVEGVRVEIVAKNGVVLTKGVTDKAGRVSLPALGKVERDRTPVAVVAWKGTDVAFLPYARRDRELDFSRFDVGGIQSVSGADLQAYLFTERGIYRPGDKIHVGYLLKQRDWSGALAGLPVEMVVTDPRGRVLKTEKLRLPEGGFGEASISTTASADSGIYVIQLYLIRDEKRKELLAGRSVWVKEFQPDRLKIRSELVAEGNEGWLIPKKVQVKVSLQNLYGSPASDRPIRAKLELSPSEFQFADYPDFRFYDPLPENRRLHYQNLELPDVRTDENGQAVIDLPLERFADATYAMNLRLEGFEGEGGRSVSTWQQALVSPLPYVVGFKASELGYIRVGEKREVEFRAIDRQLKPVRVPALSFRWIEATPISVLTKAANGNYVYDSVIRDTVLRTEKSDLETGGLKMPLDTTKVGDYRLEVRDEAGHLFTQFKFSVVGKSENQEILRKDAELSVKLPRQEFRAGEEVEIALAAPYAGSGLITLEREKVFAATWFHSTTPSSIQRIRIPDDFEGTGYLNVTLMRALDSEEVLMSPLGYAVERITVGRESRRLPIELKAAREIRPGSDLAIHYRTDRPARIAIFAVDEGILQVSDYQLPDPLTEFFEPVALSVVTSQILDLILPEYSILRRISAPGGDGEMLAKNLNPFRRVTEKPVVFWSGILDADSTDRVATYHVPDYFNGTLRIMAVALSPNSTGSAECETLARSPFVLTAGMPTAVAPGDIFEVGVTVNNGLPQATDVTLIAESSSALTILKAPDSPLKLESGQETSVTVTLRANPELGSARLRLVATGGNEESARDCTVSIRPASPYLTQVTSRHFTGASTELPISRDLAPEFRRREAGISALPLGLAGGLYDYLKNYPFGCTEQITSGARCRLLLADEADFGLSHREVVDQLESVFRVLRQRQTDQGGFGYWQAQASGGIDFISVYATEFLIEAKSAGFAPPPDVLAASLRNLRRMVAEIEPRSLAEARIQAHAIYLLTRESVITTNYIVNLRDIADRSFGQIWKQDLMAVYLAGALALLHQDDEAGRLIGGYRMDKTTSDGTFYPKLSQDSQYVSILARHFPDRFAKMTFPEFQRILLPIEKGNFSTLSAAYAVGALKSYSELLRRNSAKVELASIDAAGNARALAEKGTLTRHAEIGDSTAKVRFSVSGAPLGVFAQLIETGYDAKLSAEPVRAGLEIYRKMPDRVKVGQAVTVKLRVRSLGDRIDNAAIVDLLPGGFELADESLSAESFGFDHVEIREDRIVFFGSVDSSGREISYRIKPTSQGSFVVPPPFAESMYDRGIHARGTPARVEVVAR